VLLLVNVGLHIRVLTKIRLTNKSLCVNPSLVLGNYRKMFPLRWRIYHFVLNYYREFAWT